MTIAEQLTILNNNLESIDSEVSNQSDLIDQIDEVLEGKGGTGGSVVGTWVFKEVPTPPANTGSTYSCRFTSNNQQYIYIAPKSNLGPPVNGIRYLGNSTTNAYVYPQEEMYGFTAGWSNEAFRTINITEEPTDTEFIAWLKANAVKQAHPLAYTVSSIDELPSDAVDGSMAIVENDSLDGWWEFNSELTQPEGEIWIGFEVLDWDGNLYPMKKITQEERGDGFDLLYVRNSDEYETVFAYEYYEDEGGSWGFFAYRRIKVDTSINTPSTSQEQWFRKNAKKLKSLYIRENGEWVYKCEVA